MKHFFVAALVVFGMLFMSGPVQADLNDGLVAYYPFNGNANDESGNENHGIENGGVSYSNGVNGQALSLNGTTGYIQTANSDSLMVEDLTIAAWIYMDSIEDVSQFISCQGTNYDTTGNYQFNINKDGLVCLSANNQGHWVASNIEYVRSSEPVSISKWHHIAATFSNNKITYYFDGNVDSSAKYEIDHFRSTSDGIKIGDREYGGSYFNGMIDEMYIYNRALSESEIQQLYSGALTEPINKDENSLINYSENFSSDPNFFHYKSSNADNCEVKWTEDSYYAKVFDQNNDWWCLGHSPAFNPFSTSEDFTINFDFNPIKMDWGHYPGIYFHGSPVKNKADLQTNNNNGTLFRFVISYSDYNYKKLRFLFADSLGGKAKSYVTSTVPAENEWYHVTIDYLSATSTADLKVLRQDGSVFFEKKGVDAPISGKFNYLSIGEVGGGPAYGNKSEIMIDNIVITKNTDVDSNEITLLTKTSPNYTIDADSANQLYGISSHSQVVVERGARAELINFPGQNTIEFQSNSELFTVSRSGTVVTFEGTDGTILKIPATTDIQTIKFADKEPLTLSIYGGQVMLDDQVITTSTSPIMLSQIIDTEYSWIIPYQDTNNSKLADNLAYIGNTASNAGSSVALSYYGFALLSNVLTYTSLIIDEIQMVGGFHSTDVVILNENGVVDNDILYTGEEYSVICMNQPSSSFELPTHLHIGSEKKEIAPFMSSPFIGELIIPKENIKFTSPGKYGISCGEPNWPYNEINTKAVEVQFDSKSTTPIKPVDLTIALYDQLETAARASKAAYADEYLTRNDFLLDGWKPVELDNFKADSPEPGFYEFIYSSKGVTGSSSALFLIKELSQGNHDVIIAFGGSDDTADWINNFFSQWNGGSSDYIQSLANFSSAARALLNNLNLNRVIVTGHSLGGVVVQNFLIEAKTDNYTSNDDVFWGITFGSPGLNASSIGTVQNLLMVEHKDLAGKTDPVPGFFSKSGRILEIEYTLGFKEQLIASLFNFVQNTTVSLAFSPYGVIKGVIADELSGQASDLYVAHPLDSYILTASILEGAVTFNQWTDDVFSDTTIKRAAIKKDGTITISSENTKNPLSDSCGTYIAPGVLQLGCHRQDHR